MNSPHAERLLQHIRRLAGAGDVAETDAELLRRYRETQDRAAFAVLMQRHGAMVYAVCQSVLRRREDAEDAVQATFLVLAQKAGSIRQQEGLGGWLQRVAYRIALKARADNARRQRREAQAARSPMAEPTGDDLSWRELRSILHAELAALPESLRAPLVLCYLEGRTQEEAARQLGWPLSTVRGRLQRGREKLRRRLERRGVGLAVALGVALTGQTLAETCVRSMPPFTVAMATPTANALASGFGHAVASLKAKVVAVVLLSVGLAVGGAAMLSPKPASERPATATPDKPAAERAPKKAERDDESLPEGAILRMGSLRFRHLGLYHVAFRDDGKTLVTSGSDESFRFWDVASGRQVRAVRLKRGHFAVQSPILSADGKKAADNDRSGGIAIWDTDSGEIIKTIPDAENNIFRLSFSPDSRTLVFDTKKPQILLWDWRKETERRFTPPNRETGGNGSYHSCLSPNGKLLAIAGQPLLVYDATTKRELHRFSCNALASIFSSDSKRLFVSSASEEKNVSATVIRVFNLAEGKETKQYPLGEGGHFSRLAVTTDGKFLLCGSPQQSCLLDTTTGRVTHRCSEGSHRFYGGVPQVAFSPDNKIFAAQIGNSVRLGDVKTGRALHERSGEFGLYLTTALSTDGRLLAAADWMEEAVNLWDTKTGQLLRTLPLEGMKRFVRTLHFSADGKTLVAVQAGGFVQVWDTVEGKERHRVQLHAPGWWGHNFVSPFDVHLSPDGKRISTLERAVVAEQVTRVASWDTTTGKLLEERRLPLHTVISAWSEQGNMVTLAEPDGLAFPHLENNGSISRIRRIVNESAWAITPDGRLIAVRYHANSNTLPRKQFVGIWEAATGKRVADLEAEGVVHLALMPDNRHLAVTDRGFLRLFDLATGKERRRWPLPEANTHNGDDSVVARLLLSPDGRRAFTALNDGTALVWDLQPALRPGKPLVEKPSDKELAAWWTALAAEDARRAYAALWRLTDAPEAAIPFLRRHLKPATEADLKAIRRLVADLDSDDFASREKASEQLAQRGALAEPILRLSLAQKPTLEARQRMQLLLEKIERQPPSGETLRRLRTLQVLEKSGAEGHRLLRELAGGAEEAWLTRESKAALMRLSRRSP